MKGVFNPKTAQATESSVDGPAEQIYSEGKLLLHDGCSAHVKKRRRHYLGLNNPNRWITRRNIFLVNYPCLRIIRHSIFCCGVLKIRKLQDVNKVYWKYQRANNWRQKKKSLLLIFNFSSINFGNDFIAAKRCQTDILGTFSINILLLKFFGYFCIISNLICFVLFLIKEAKDLKIKERKQL